MARGSYRFATAQEVERERTKRQHALYTEPAEAAAVVILVGLVPEMTGVPEGSVDAIAFSREAIARSLVQARETAELTQSELAKKLKVSQSMIANAEAGRTRVSEKYVARVLKACGLPKRWKPEKS